MKLKLIGTGAIGALQSSACTLINDDILVDMPNGIVKRMKQLGVDVSKIKRILITHLHGDHFLDIPFFMFEKFFTKNNDEIEIFCPPETQEKVKQIFDITFPGDYERVTKNTNIKFYEFNKLDKKEILENVFVTSYVVEHGNLKNSNGYIIENENKIIGFSGDSRLCDNIEEIVSKSDISILDMSLAEDGNNSHMGLNDIEFLCNKYKDKKIITTHMQDYTRKMAKLKGIENLIVPEDGDIIEI